MSNSDELTDFLIELTQNGEIYKLTKKSELRDIIRELWVKKVRIMRYNKRIMKGKKSELWDIIRELWGKKPELCDINSIVQDLIWNCKTNPELSDINSELWYIKSQLQEKSQNFEV